MRYDIAVVFVNEKGKRYDPKQRKEVAVTDTHETLVNVTYSSMEQTQLAVGNTKDDVAVIRTRQPYNATFSYVVINGEKYQLVKRVKLPRTTSLIVTRKQGEYGRLRD